VKPLVLVSPRADGVEVLEQVTADPDLKVIPAVMLTSSREERDLVVGYDPGANACGIKPTESRDFADVTRERGSYGPASPARGLEALIVVNA
jgi:CheY-like chemotaxis protein